MNISILNPAEHPHWDELLLTADRATFFHSSAWARVLCESYGYTPLYFTTIEKGKLCGLISVMEIKSFLTGKRGVSLPFTDMCSPLAKDQAIFAALLKEAAAYGRQVGWKQLEIRGGACFLAKEPFCAEHLVHTLELNADETEVSAKFKPNIRRNIRKAEKESVKVTIDRSLESVVAFYQLHCGTRRNHGLPPQPWSFFRKIHKHVIATGKGFVAMAEFRDRWVAGAVIAVYRDQAIYKYGASERNFQHLRPNNLVLWKAIQWCCQKGIRSFSFGRTEPKNEGLAQFKRAWGTLERKLRYFKYDLTIDRFVMSKKSGAASHALFRIMPLSVLKMVGEISYRHYG
jgi:hypothetical protein